MPEPSRRSDALIQVGPLQQALALATEAGDFQQLHDIAAMGAALRKGAEARGLGIESENEAAEVILRAERAMGTLLSQAESKGLYGEGAVQRGSQRPGQRGAGTPRGVGPVERREGVITNGELGIRSQDGINFRLLATLPADKFESLLNEVKSLGTRIAKTDFYRKAASPKTGTTSVVLREPVTPEDSGFSSLRTGAYRLLGWEVNDEGIGSPTRNGLTALPTDQLAQVAVLIRALANAYTEARNARA